MNRILLAVSMSYLVYNIAQITANFIYKNYIIYKARLKKIEDQTIVTVGTSKKKEKSKIKLSVPEKVQEALLQAGVHLKPDEYMMIRGAIIIVPALLAFIFSGNPIAPVALAGVGFILPPVILKGKKKKRMELFNDQLGDVIMIISNSLRAGFTFEQAMGSVAKDLPDPIGPEFLKIIREVELGERLEKAMEDTAYRMNSKDMELMNTAVAIQRQVGGNLADVLDNIGGTIRDRIIIKKKIKAMSAQGEISGKVIGILPILLLGVITLVNREYMEPMFTTSFGHMLLGLSFILEVVGFLVIKKIIDIEV